MQIGELVLRQEGAQRGFLAGSQQLREGGMPAAFRNIRDQRPGHERDFQCRREPLGERALPAVAFDAHGPVKPRCGEHGRDGLFRILGHDTYRIARLVANTRTGE